ncbi:hypothetical protein AKJ16_DCAP12209 [Drosera capensis]
MLSVLSAGRILPLADFKFDVVLYASWSAAEVAAFLCAGLPNGESNDEIIEFDPIKHHNSYCPWVNGNVAAAGCSSNSSSSSVAVALCGWQLTLDAVDAFQSAGHIPAQTVESESAASLYKDELAPGRKLLARHSFSKSRG